MRVLQIARSGSDLFQARFGGMIMMQRINNTNDAIHEWQVAASNRTGLPVVVTAGPAANQASVNQSLIWVGADVSPRTSANIPFIGRDFSAKQQNRDGLASLQRQAQLAAGGGVNGAGGAAAAGGSSGSGGATNSATSQQFTALSPLFFFSTVKAWGFVMYSTVYDDDPLRVVMIATPIVDEFFKQVSAAS